MATPQTRAEPFRWLLGLAAFVIVVAGLRAAQPLVVPFLVAAFLAVLCAPAMQALQKRGLPQSIALGVVILGVTLAMLAAAGIATRSIADFVGKESQYRAALGSGFEQIVDWLDGRGVPREFFDLLGLGGSAVEQAGEVVEGVGAVSQDQRPAVDPSLGGLAADRGPDGRKLEDQLRQLASGLIGLLTGLLGGLSSLFSNAFLVLMTVLFMLLEAAGMSSKLIAMSGGSTRSLEQAEKIRVAVLRYTTLKTWISLLLGVCVWLLLVALGVPYPALWALLAFLLNFIPNIGSFIAAVPAVIVALVVFDEAGATRYDLSRAVSTAVGYGVINLVVSNLLEPRVMGKDLGLSALVVFVSLVFWGWVLGPVGLLFSVPLTMVVKIVMENFDQTRWLAVLLSADPEHLE